MAPALPVLGGLATFGSDRSGSLGHIVGMRQLATPLLGEFRRTVVGGDSAVLLNTEIVGLKELSGKDIVVTALRCVTPSSGPG